MGFIEIYSMSRLAVLILATPHYNVAALEMASHVYHMIKSKQKLKQK